MMAFAVLYERAREDSSIYRMHFQRQHNSPWDSGKLIRHKVVQGAIQFEVPQLLCADDTALVFANIDNTGVGVNLAFDIFASLVWEMHIGRDKKDLKAECVFFPPPGHFKPNFMSNVFNANSSDFCKPPKRESSAARTKRDNKACDNCPETDPVAVSSGFIAFSRNFKHLGSWVLCNLKDDFDVSARITSDYRCIGALHSFWRWDQVELHRKHLICMAIPINLLLWGCGSWALKESLVKSTDVFLHSSIRRILRITMLDMKNEHTKSETIRKTFFNITNTRKMIEIH